MGSGSNKKEGNYLAYQHRVLFWGIMGALVLRGSMIWAGTALVRQFEWTLIVFGAFLFFSGIRLLFTKEESVEPGKNILMRLARRFLPISPSYDQQRLITIVNGYRMFTSIWISLVSRWVQVRNQLKQKEISGTSNFLKKKNMRREFIGILIISLVSIRICDWKRACHGSFEWGNIIDD